MLIKLKFDVTYLDGRKVEVVSRPSTDVAFEAKYNRTVMSLFTSAAGAIPDSGTSEQLQDAALAFANDFRSDYIYFLAHHSSKSELPYEEWLELVDEIGWSFAGQVDPTVPTALAGL